MKSILKKNTRYHSNNNPKTKLAFDNNAFISLNNLTVTSKALKNNGGNIKEYDFDIEVPELYKSIQKNNWTDCSRLAESNPEQASCWVFRKEKDGKLRWKLLPLHAAIIFKAPANVIEELLDAYPQGAQSVDDQGMLPLHLAFRDGSEQSIVKNILVAYPLGISVKDKKGRVPLVVAQESNNQNKRTFRWVLERAPSYYAAAIAACEIEKAVEESTRQFDEKMKKKESEFKAEIAEARDSARKQEAINETLKLNIQEWKIACSESKVSCTSLQRRLDAKLNSETYVKQLSSEKDKYYLEYKKEKGRADKLQMKVNELEQAMQNIQSKLNGITVKSKDHDYANIDDDELKDISITEEVFTDKKSVENDNPEILINSKQGPSTGDSFLQSRRATEKIINIVDSRFENEELRA